jgi:hypothetical protein
METVEQRLVRLRRVTPSGCWEWTGPVLRNGYGKTLLGSRAGGAKRKNVYTHRLAYELWKGPIPAELEIDHLCRNRKCFNPDHLETVTRRENTLRGMAPVKVALINGAKTRCLRGHRFDATNTRIRPGGGRTCRACERERRAAS